MLCPEKNFMSEKKCCVRKYWIKRIVIGSYFHPISASINIKNYIDHIKWTIWPRIGSSIISGSQKIGVIRNFWSENNLGPNFGSEKCWLQENLGYKMSTRKFGVHKRFGGTVLQEPPRHLKDTFKNLADTQQTHCKHFVTPFQRP